MDPNMTLKCMREAATEIADAGITEIDPIRAQELADWVLALDLWIASGGFLPTRWNNG